MVLAKDKLAEDPRDLAAVVPFKRPVRRPATRTSVVSRHSLRSKPPYFTTRKVPNSISSTFHLCPRSLPYWFLALPLSVRRGSEQCTPHKGRLSLLCTRTSMRTTCTLFRTSPQGLLVHGGVHVPTIREPGFSTALQPGNPSTPARPCTGPQRVVNGAVVRALASEDQG